MHLVRGNAFSQRMSQKAQPQQRIDSQKTKMRRWTEPVLLKCRPYLRDLDTRYQTHSLHASKLRQVPWCGVMQSFRQEFSIGEKGGGGGSGGKRERQERKEGRERPNLPLHALMY